MQIPRNFAVLVVCLHAAFTLLSSATGQDQSRAAKALPERGKTLVAIGSSWGKNVAAYSKATGHKPQGLKFFVGLNTNGDVDYVRHQIAQVKDVPGGFLAMTIHLDPEFPKPPPPPRPNLSKPWWDGEKDDVIREMGRTLKGFAGLVFADLGGEFDVGHRGIPEDYIKAYRHIHDLWEREGVKNILYVWHSACVEERQEAYYPGDDYVDVVAFSAYDRTQMTRGARLAQTHRSKGKIAAVYESGLNPRGKGKTSWGGYYRPMFSLVESSDVRLVCYNNFGDDYGQFYPPDDPFRDTQMDQMPREIREGWSRTMNSPRYRISTEHAPAEVANRRGVLTSANGAGKLLFNGTDLTGWSAYFKGGDAQAEDEFSITSKGVLALKGRHEGYLSSDEPHKDFLLTFDWRFPKGGRRTGSGSGLLLGMDDEDGWLSHGFEVQIASKNCGDLWVYDGFRFDGQHFEGRFGRLPKRAGAEKPVGEWNTYEIRCEGSKVVVRLNGKVVNQAMSDRPIVGRIGLISQGTDVEFRDLRLTPLRK